MFCFLGVFFLSAKITQCSFFHVFCSCFFSPKTSANAFRSFRRRLDFATNVPSLPCLPAVAAVVVGWHSAGLFLRGGIVMEVGWNENEKFFSYSIQQPHCLNPTAVSVVSTRWAVTPLNLTTLCHPDTFKHWLQSPGSTTTCCQVREDHYLQ